MLPVHLCTSVRAHSDWNQYGSKSEDWTPVAFYTKSYIGCFSGLREKMGDELRVDKLNAESTVNSALENSCREEFKESPRMQHLPEHQAAMLLKNLSGYLKRCIFGDINIKREDYCPTYFELEFGNKAKPDRPRDPESSDRPLVIHSDDGDTAALCGKIDRVDLSSKGCNGNRL